MQTDVVPAVPPPSSCSEFSVGDKVKYVVSTGVIVKIPSSGRCKVEWTGGPWKGKQKGYFRPSELSHIPNAAMSHPYKPWEGLENHGGQTPGL